MTTLVGTRQLVRLILRRDRWPLAFWIIGLVAYAGLALAFSQDANPTAADRAAYAEAINGNAGFLLLEGRAYGASAGALAAWWMGDTLWVTALVSVIFVIRHTRGEEEVGRRALLGTGVLGRQANLAAAVLVAAAANLAVASLTAATMVAQRLPVGGSIALGAKVALVGLIFAATAAVAAQLTETAAAARGMAVGILGSAFLLRAAGDVGGEGGAAGWLAWASPIGWAHRIQPYAGDRWWVVLLFAAVTATLLTTAVALSARRDIGAGVLSQRRGPSAASRRLAGPFALAWRLHRGPLLAWSLGFAIFGAVLLGSAKAAADLFAAGDVVRDMFVPLGGGGTAVPSDVFLAGTVALFGMLAGAYAISAGLRLRHEEAASRAEPILATATGRVAWAASHLCFSLAGPAIALAGAGSAGGLVYGLSVGDVSGQLPRVLAAAMVQLPAVWLLAGVTLALCGLAPRFAAAAWVPLGAFVFVWFVGTMFLQLSPAVLELSPFTHIPTLPAGAFAAAPLLWLTAIAAALVVAGLGGVRRRDLARA